MMRGHVPFVRKIVYGGNGGIVFLFSLGWVVDGWTCWGSQRSPATYAVGKDIPYV
jgi:hypothetical protein